MTDEAVRVPTNDTSTSESVSPVEDGRKRQPNIEHAKLVIEVATVVAALVTIGVLWYQIQLQREIDVTNQRAQFLEVIYGRRDCDTDSIDDCPFVASTRVRKEAALAFVKIEKQRNEHPDLASVDLSSSALNYTDLGDIDLTGANLFGANLENAILIKTNLTGANLTGANLNGADLNSAPLFGADLISATLVSTYLGGTNLTNADLTNADLTNANLEDANLDGAILIDTKFETTRYNDNTIWPEGFDYRGAGVVKTEK